MTDLGDAASCAVAAATLARLSHDLRVEVRRVGAAYADAGRAWTGPSAVASRRRADLLVAATEQVAAQAEAGAAALRDHGVLLAGLADRGRRLEEEATARGLRLGEDGPVPAYGIRGEADPAGAARLDADAARVRQEWTALRSELAAAGTRLTGLVDGPARRLAAAAATLRAL